MPTIQRPLSADLLTFDLDEERRRTEDPAAIERRGPSARTLVKEGPLRVTLVVLGAGGAIAEHHAAGPITVHVLRGTLRFSALGHGVTLGAGEMISLRAGVRHDVASEDGATFLLTVALPVASPPAAA